MARRRPVSPSRMPRARRRWCGKVGLWLLGLGALVLLPLGAAAQNRPLSDYEKESIRIALGRIGGGQREFSPEGKTVEDIQVVTLEVFEERDQVPTFINWLHTITRDDIIEREVLMRPGKPYQQTLVDESERNLRGFIQLSVVLIVPLKGSSPDKVKLLVITKDVWSLRLSWDPSFYNGKLTYLALAPSEWNIAGTTQTISARLTLTARNYWLGGTYSVPRIGGSRIQASVSGNAVLNCQTNNLEGATGYLQYGQPLYSTRARWSWRTAASWSSLIRQPVEEFGQAVCADQGAPARRVTGLDVARSTEATIVPSDGEPITRSLELRRDVLVPIRYREERLRGQLELTRSFYVVDKYNLSFGLEADQRMFNDVSNDDELTAIETRWLVDPSGNAADRWVQNGDRYGVDDPRFSPELLESARRGYRTSLALNNPSDGSLLPRHRLLLSDRRISPYFQLRAFHAGFLRTINYNRLGLQEDIRLGHEVYLRLYPALRPLSSRDMLGVFTSASYTWQLGSGFVRVLGAATMEMAADGNEELTEPISGMAQSDAGLDAAVHFASPNTPVGRFVSAVSAGQRPVRFIQRFGTSLGGTDRLRGYQPSAFFGTGRFVMNNEFRSRPVRLLNALVGLSFFHDLGDANNRLDDLKLKHGGGIGLRILFPQLDRDVIRLDFGFPLQSHERGEFTFSAGFGQVVTEPIAPPPALLSQ